MANHISHASLPFVVKNARYTVLVPFLDVNGDPTDPTAQDSEVSQDNGAFANAAEGSATLASGGRGMGMLTLSGAETNNSAVGVWFGCSTAKPTLQTLYPRVLPLLSTGTASAGAAGSITLGTILTYDISGCIVKTTGGTGGGGTGGANNQARVVTAYDTATGAATVVPNWETTPDATTTYQVLGTEMMVTSATGIVATQSEWNTIVTNVNATISSRATPAQVNTEVLDVLNVDTFAQPGQENPAATTSLRLMLAYLYKAWRNRTAQTTSQYSLYNDDAATIDQKGTYSNNGTTAARGEIATGP